MIATTSSQMRIQHVAQTEVLLRGATPLAVERDSKTMLPPQRGVAHVWTIDLEDETQVLRTDCLSSAERERARRFAFERDRARFLTSHSALREILAKYMSVPPRDIVYVENTLGKPELAARIHRSAPITFSLSHSANLAVVLIGSASAVGVDVEARSLPRDHAGVARMIFSPEEFNAFESTSDANLATHFMTCWTRKEAYLKALGVGFTRDASKISVGIAAAQTAIKPIEPNSIDPTVFVQTIDNNNHLISLAMTDPIERIERFRFS